MARRSAAGLVRMEAAVACAISFAFHGMFFHLEYHSPCAAPISATHGIPTGLKRSSALPAHRRRLLSPMAKTQSPAATPCASGREVSRPTQPHPPTSQHPGRRQKLHARHRRPRTRPRKTTLVSKSPAHPDLLGDRHSHRSSGLPALRLEPKPGPIKFARPSAPKTPKTETPPRRPNGNKPSRTSPPARAPAKPRTKPPSTSARTLTSNSPNPPTAVKRAPRKQPARTSPRQPYLRRHPLRRPGPHPTHGPRPRTMAAHLSRRRQRHKNRPANATKSSSSTVKIAPHPVSKTPPLPSSYSTTPTIPEPKSKSNPASTFSTGGASFTKPARTKTAPKFPPLTPNSRGSAKTILSSAFDRTSPCACTKAPSKTPNLPKKSPRLIMSPP